jgi:hypothetical protein
MILGQPLICPTYHQIILLSRISGACCHALAPRVLSILSRLSCSCLFFLVRHGLAFLGYPLSLLALITRILIGGFGFGSGFAKSGFEDRDPYQNITHPEHQLIVCLQAKYASKIGFEVLLYWGKSNFLMSTYFGVFSFFFEEYNSVFC